MRIERDFLLEKYNTFHLPVRTQWFMEYACEDDLLKILCDEYFLECSKIHIGGGSNLLFLEDYSGIVLHSAIKGMHVVEETENEVLVRVGAAEVWDDVVAFCVMKGWGGTENLSLIPGETGAAAIQNIGAYGVEVKDVIESVEAYNMQTGEKRIFRNEECNYGYRSSIFKTEYDNQYIITYVTFRLSKKPELSISYGNLKDELQHYPETTLATIREAVITIRKQKLPDPAELGNAGSFFMNPIISKDLYEIIKQHYPDAPSYPAADGKVKVPAGWLIEQCGFKGKSFGKVSVYEKQALILINLGGASGSDIALLAESIRAEVVKNFGIEITPEVKYIG